MRVIRCCAVLVLGTALGAMAAVGGGCIAGATHAGVYEHAAVAADHEIASKAGAEILKAGGNAVDAAVATSFALSVVRPYSCGIGGGGFMVIHLQDDPRHGTMQTAINYREVAPAAVGTDYFEGQDDPLASVRGGKAAGVPGTVAGLLYALEKYGTMDRQAVLAPAIRAAERGFKADTHYAETASELIEDFEANPAWKERFAFVWERYLLGGEVARGDRIRVPEQARALRLIALSGAPGFYDGEVGEAILRALRGDGGDQTIEDLRGYTVREIKPLRFGFCGYEIVGMPPPSSGGVAMGQILGLLERWNFRGYRDEPFGWRPAGFGPGTHLLAESFKHAFADRARWLGDSDFVEVPVDRLLDEKYLDALADRIDMRTTHGPEHYGSAGLERSVSFAPPEIDGGTSHFCVVDDRGSAVSCTETINFEFGSLVAVPEFGFCLNDEMDDFTTVRDKANAFGLRQSELNLPTPGKRPLSSMSPTIALDEDGRVYALAGASGGPRIITGTTQVLVSLLLGNGLRENDAESALWALRVHHQWMPNQLRLPYPQLTLDAEDGRVASLSHLRALGHELRHIRNVGNVQAIVRGEDGWEAASDPNKGGRPAGY